MVRRLRRTFDNPLRGTVDRSPGKRARSDHADGRGFSGFTLVELMIVMLIIGVLTAIAVPNYLSSLKGAKEAVLKEDLHVMRQAIDAYTVDKERAPQSLDDLVQAGYLKTLPIDPMTRSSTTWVVAMTDTLHTLEQTDPGIDDVHSGSQEASSNGELYSSW